MAKNVKMHAAEPGYIVMPLVALALATNLFLFAVSYTNASFQRQEYPLPSIIGQSQTMAAIDSRLEGVGQNLAQAYATVGSLLKPTIVGLLGLQDYKYGVPLRTALAPRPASSAYGQATEPFGQVLGVMIINPDYLGVR